MQPNALFPAGCCWQGRWAVAAGALTQQPQVCRWQRLLNTPAHPAPLCLQATLARPAPGTVAQPGTPAAAPQPARCSNSTGPLTALASASSLAHSADTTALASDTCFWAAARASPIRRSASACSLATCGHGAKGGGGGMSGLTCKAGAGVGGTGGCRRRMAGR